jgi:hypothetical protein
MRFSKEKELSIVEDYNKGLNTVQIANKWGTYNTSIRRVLIRYGIRLRSTKEVLSKMKSNPFRIGDEYSEYFLGLLLTDGCIYYRKDFNSVSVALSLKDKEMVYKFRDFMCPEYKVSKVKQKKFNTYMYTISVRSDEVAQWLEKQGNFHNKSYKCDIYIPLTAHILRGIFDGDGYWHTINKGSSLSWGVCGRSLIFLKRIQTYLLEKEIESYLHKRCRREGRHLYYLEIYKTEDVVKVANLMYKESSIYLMRKYDKWHLFEETLRVKFSKFKEEKDSFNPEPSYDNNGYLRNNKNGRYMIEGAETIMRFLNT